LKAISSLDILALLPLAVGGILGTYLTARILEQLIKKHREDTFLIILGFMLVSLRSLLPEHLIEENLLAGVGALVLGFVSLYFLSAK
ncbi:MAG: undecaprenyl phosphate translocase family protein, partial [Clostridium sp.]